MVFPDYYERTQMNKHIDSVIVREYLINKGYGCFDSALRRELGTNLDISVSLFAENYWRKYNGKKFYHVKVYPNTKQSAEHQANILRKHGYLVRILKPFAVYGSSYTLWAHRR